MVKTIDELNIKIFADGANLNEMLEMNSKNFIKGLTTNPTLMKKSGITNYREFAKQVLSEVNHKPVSFEVFSDEPSEMIRQGIEIAGWAENVYVKIPITNTRNESSLEVIKTLVKMNVKVNVTAVMTLEQVKSISDAFDSSVSSYVSIFAGRIADTGRDPISIISEAINVLNWNPKIEVIWASPRELLNIFQANDIGCHIITATKDILNKIPLINYSLENYSLETVKMFHNDAIDSGYVI
jgi:transaldolase